MNTQAHDLAYGEQREIANHGRLERWLGLKLKKLDKYNIMDWKEIQEDGDETPPWLLEQKARQMTYDFCFTHYHYNERPTALIGKHKIEHMKLNGNGIVLIDFKDKLMFWIFDETEYATFDVEAKFVRNTRSDYVDKPADVVHIPLSALKEVPI